MTDAETMLDRIAAAESLGDLEALRVSALGKSGSITAMLKSLGAMDAGTRAAEAPKIHALREQVTGAIAERKAALEAAELERKLATEKIDLSLPARDIVSGTVHPVSQVMDELAEIFADPASRSRKAPRSRASGTISPRSTCPRTIRRARCRTLSTSSPGRATTSRACCAPTPPRCRSGRWKSMARRSA